MIVSVSSIASTTAHRPPEADHLHRQSARRPLQAAKPSVAGIVTSVHARTGRTLLARVLAEHFVLSGQRPLIFDTDPVEHRLQSCFPHDTIVVDMNEVRDQMTLFDTLAAPSPESRVADVSHQAFRKFFRVMSESGFESEAREHNIAPVIFYMTDRNPDSYEQGRLLRERFSAASFVLVENAFVGEVKEVTRNSTGYQALSGHELRMTMPVLEPEFAEVLEDPQLSLSDLMRQPMALDDTRPEPRDELSFRTRSAIRGWLIRMFREIHRVSHAIEARSGETAGNA
jgi:hypothetical protein